MAHQCLCLADGRGGGRCGGIADIGGDRLRTLVGSHRADDQCRSEYGVPCRTGHRRQCTRMAAKEPDRGIGITSTSRLSVLGGLGRQVAPGHAAWRRVVPVSEHLKGKASGEFRYEAIGAR